MFSIALKVIFDFYIKSYYLNKLFYKQAQYLLGYLQSWKTCKQIDCHWVSFSLCSDPNLCEIISWHQT